MNKQQYRVFFVQKNSEGAFETESLWCSKVDEKFRIDNIPFIAKRISLGDVIVAELDNDEKVYYFEDFASVSGNTTVRLYLNDIDLIESTRKKLQNMGCESEVLLQKKIIAVNIPKGVDYLPIKKILDNGEIKHNWTYEESCLAHKY